MPNDRLPRALPRDQMTGYSGPGERDLRRHERQRRQRDDSETRKCDREKCPKRFRPIRPNHRYCSARCGRLDRAATHRAAIAELQHPDRHCARHGCRNQLTAIAWREGDSFCSAACCRAWHGVRFKPDMGMLGRGKRRAA